jgi:hypothetical protein
MAENSVREHAHFEDEFLYDARLIERHLARGLITRQSLNKHLEGLRDVAAHGQNIDLDQLTAIASARRPSR